MCQFINGTLDCGLDLTSTPYGLNSENINNNYMSTYMNDLLAKLFDQAIVLEEGDDYVQGEADPEKFAELIVLECVHALEQMPRYYRTEHDRQLERDTIADCISTILQHFGVDR